jgi:hypothetical protein
MPSDTNSGQDNGLGQKPKDDCRVHAHSKANTTLLRGKEAEVEILALAKTLQTMLGWLGEHAERRLAKLETEMEANEKLEGVETDCQQLAKEIEVEMWHFLMAFPF